MAKDMYERTVNAFSSLRRIFLRGQEETDLSTLLTLSPHTAWSQYYQRLTFGEDRASLYREFDEMDKHDVIAACLDTYAEEAAQLNPDTGRTMWVEAQNEDVAAILTRMFIEIKLEDTIHATIRNLCKYGDVFRAIHRAAPGKEAADGAKPRGVIRHTYIEPIKVERQEVEGRLLGFTVQGHNLAWMPWTISHFRLLSEDESSERGKYGRSILYSIRRVFRQLSLMEDALVVYRLWRHPDRLLWMIDVGESSPRETWKIVRMYQRLRKRSTLNIDTGQFKSQWAPPGIDQDIYMPTRANCNTKVEKLAASSNVSDVYDIEYMGKKMHGGLRIPRAYLGFEGDIDLKATLGNQNMRFARLIKRLQRAILVGYAELCQIHLSHMGLDPSQRANDFTLHLTPVDLLEEAQRHDLMMLRVELLGALANFGVTAKLDQKKWATYILVEYGGFSQAQALEMVSGQEVPTEGGEGTPGAIPMGLPTSSEEGGGEVGAGEEVGAAEGEGGEEAVPPAEGRISLSAQDRALVRRFVEHNPRLKKVVQAYVTSVTSAPASIRSSEVCLSSLPTSAGNTMTQLLEGWTKIGYTVQEDLEEDDEAGATI